MANRVELAEGLLEAEDGNGDVEMEGAEETEIIEVDIGDAGETGEDGALLPDITDTPPKRIMFLEWVARRQISRSQKHCTDAYKAILNRQLWKS